MPSHNQRMGQWLYNKVRENRNPIINSEYDILIEKANILDIIWNMSNEEFMRIMDEYSI